MTDARRAALQARAFATTNAPTWRARLWLTFLVAAVLANTGQRWPATLLLATAVPTAARYARRELAVGALLADERARRRELARIPLGDARAME